MPLEEGVMPLACHRQQVAGGCLRLIELWLPQASTLRHLQPACRGEQHDTSPDV